MSSEPDLTIFCWGNNVYGQLGIPRDDSDEDDAITLPTQVFFTDCETIKHVAFGWNHTVYILNNGSVYTCGLNENGQCGHAQTDNCEIKQLDSLETQQIQYASCGEAHSVLVNDKGQLLAFGQNSNGQLGLQTENDVSVPRIVRGFPYHTVITRVTCGKQHTVALSTGGNIFCWGDNKFGQIGNGCKNEKRTSPTLIQKLIHYPIHKIAAGGFHTMALSISGTLFSWGKNSNGQLGLGNDIDVLSPTKVQFLTHETVRHVCCGEEHSVVLTLKHRVFTFGAGSSGQLGHNNFDDMHFPKMVVELMGRDITQIACGRKHTFAYEVKLGKLFAFGLGVRGQLGINSFDKQNCPVLTLGSWAPISPRSIEVIHEKPCSDAYFHDSYHDMLSDIHKTIESTKMGDGKQGYFLRCISAGGLKSCAVLCKQEYINASVVFHTLLTTQMLHVLNEVSVEKLKMHAETGSPVEKERAVHKLMKIFSSASCLNASFLNRYEHESTESSGCHGIMLTLAKKSLLMLCSNDHIHQLVLNCVKDVLLPSLLSNPPANNESLRVYLLLPLLPPFSNIDQKWKILLPYCKSIQQLSPDLQKYLCSWFSKLPPTLFEHLVQSYKECAMSLLHEKLPNRTHQFIFSLHAALDNCMWFLELLNRINEETDQLVVYQTFYLNGLMGKIDMKTDYINWIQEENVFSFCKFPFALDVNIKSYLLQTDAELQMKVVVNETAMFNLARLAQGVLDHPIDPFLVLNVRRDHIVEDSLVEIMKYHPHEFKKPLKVKFSNEAAEDAGGVRKEFFLLLMKEIIHPQYGMFEFHESQVVWFNPASFEGSEMFSLIGVICGLAIYNSTIIDLHFPLCLYKKLLQKRLSLDDLRGVQPAVAKNLQSLLDYQGDDFVQTFDLNFQITEVFFGQTKHFDLVPNGADKVVTIENREEFVNKYIDYKLNKSIEVQYEAFAMGFHRVCGGRVLNFFQPQELMEMVVGSQDYDLNDLEKIAEYKGEYYRHHPVIKNFWEVFQEFNLDMKKKFLVFLTGSSNVPIHGLLSMKFIIQPVQGGENCDHLPVAHTCFNLLDLPRYPTIEIMRNKLQQSIENCQGFGLV